MNILILHPNFPGQYLNLARHFAAAGRHRVFFLTKETNGNQLRGVTVATYKTAREATPNVHPYLKPCEEAILEGQAVARGLDALKRQADFVPDVIIGHTGWGSTLYTKDVYPKVPLVGYFEWYYWPFGSDVGYWPDEQVDINSQLRIRTLNAHHLLNLEACDVRYTPTEWQKKQFPDHFQQGMHVIHEGIETKLFQPKKGAKMVLPRIKLDLSEVPEIVTYVSRGFEPYRGFPEFMDTIRILLKRRPECHVVIVGVDRSCYGPAPKDTTWKKIEEEKGGYDTNRVHFTGHLNRDEYLTVLQASTVHVYLTRPFVLSWSSLESMSAGCCLVGSKTPPVMEVVEDGVNGLLANFRRPEHIALRIEEALDDPELRARLGKAARETILERFDMDDCMRKQVNMIYGAMK
ncbi:MAG: glycosyltransferase [Schwartzia sp.]|nr:glycosyltransferase [Schwartzia sp. (in: firmicutes)]